MAAGHRQCAAAARELRLAHPRRGQARRPADRATVALRVRRQPENRSCHRHSDTVGDRCCVPTRSSIEKTCADLRCIEPARGWHRSRADTASAGQDRLPAPAHRGAGPSDPVGAACGLAGAGLCRRRYRAAAFGRRRCEPAAAARQRPDRAGRRCIDRRRCRGRQGREPGHEERADRRHRPRDRSGARRLRRELCPPGR